MLSVVIGRFQTPWLHEGHLELLWAAKAQSENVLILIGCAAAIGTDKNPMDFHTRALLFQNCEVRPLYDMPCDKDWSMQIDQIITDLGFEEAVIFAGRDNSIEGYYSGKHKISVIDDKLGKSATALRKKVAATQLPSSDFRSGIIYHAENRYPIVYSTVDIVLWRHGASGYQILVGKKGNKYAFIGGFVDPSDKNLFEAAQRELFEETGIKKEILAYVDSMKIEDRRYIGTKDSIMTHIFQGIHNDLPDLSKIQDKEFSEFRFVGEDEINLIQDYHKPIALHFFNSKN